MDILLVDDEVYTLRVLKSAVHWEDCGIENVWTALSAARAREILEEHPVDLTICDIEMPKKTGLFWDMLLDLTKLIRKGNLLTGYRPFKVYLAAWSQSVSYMIRILKSFAGLPQNCGHGFLYDGYFHAVF